MKSHFEGTGFERNDDISKLQDFIRRKAESYRAENIPVGNDGRIDMEAYSDIYPELWRDLAKKRRWLLDDEEKIKERLKTDGERLEMLAFAVLTKNLGDEFIVARTSFYDDQINKVDTLVLERKTGTLVCAFDEVGDTTGNIFKEKHDGVLDKNLNYGGAYVKYSLASNIKNNPGKVVLAESKNLPIFYLAVPPDRIREGIREFSPDMESPSEYEKQLFSYFMLTIATQIQGLELYTARLNLYPALKSRLDSFKETVKARGGKI